MVTYVICDPSMTYLCWEIIVNFQISRFPVKHQVGLEPLNLMFSVCQIKVHDGGRYHVESSPLILFLYDNGLRHERV